MTLEYTLTDSEKLAHLDADELHRLVGLVEYDSESDPFPVSAGTRWCGWSATRPRPPTTSSPSTEWNSSRIPARTPEIETITRTYCAAVLYDS